MKSDSLNLRHPGSPDYVGPEAGWCLLPYHDVLCDFCADIPSRWITIVREKPATQIPIRDAHFVVVERFTR